MYRMLALLFSALVSAGAAETWRIVPVASTVAFDGTSTLHDFHGTATLSGGALRLGPEAAGAVECDAASMATADNGRDERMHNFVMDVAAFPRVRFELTGFTAAPDGGIAHGLWIMHGVRREIDINVRLEPGTPTRAKADFALNIRRWGIRTPRMMFITVGDQVTVHLDLALVADAAVPLPPASPRDLATISLHPAGGGAACDLAAARGVPVVVFDRDGSDDAAGWIAALAARLPVGTAPFPVLADADLDAPSAAKAARSAPVGTLWDRRLALRGRLGLPTVPLCVLAVAADGTARVIAEGAVDDAKRDAVLAACGHGR